MRKSIVFLVIMVMLCSTAYAIYQEPASTGVLTSRSIVIKTTPITGDIIDPLFRTTSKTEQKGLIIWNGKTGSKSIGGGGDPHAPVGIIGDCGRQANGVAKGVCDTTVKGYPGRDGKQQQAKTSIIDPIFQKGIVDPTFKTGTKSIIDPSFIVDPTFRPTSGQSTKGIVDPTFKTGTKSIIDPSFRTGTNAIIDPLFAPTSGQSTKGIVDPTFKTGAGRKYTRSPTTGRWVEDITTEAVINVPKLTQTSMSSNPYYLGGAEKTMTAGQAYSMGQKSITQASNPYALGGAAVPTTAGTAKDVDALLKERQQRAIAALGRVY